MAEEMPEESLEESSEESPGIASEEPKLWQYGSLYWGVAVGLDKPTSRMYLEADGIKVAPNGSLVFTGAKGPLFIVAAGNWFSVWAASTSDGTPVAVHKTEEVT